MIAIERYYKSDIREDVQNFELAGEYSATTPYKKGNIVVYGSDSYICIDDCTGVIPGTDAEKWKMVVSGNITENRLMGEWSDAIQYVVGNCVTYNGALWQAMANGSGVPPAPLSLYWKMLLDSSDIGDTVPIDKGGTGAVTAAQALTNLGALPKSGGTMTGNLILKGDPTTTKGAATKGYVDTSVQDAIDSFAQAIIGGSW